MKKRIDQLSAPPNKLLQLQREIDLKTKYMCKKMGCPVIPKVKFSSHVDENSAQTYLDGTMVFNDEYVWLNKGNKVVMHNLIAHECAHLADPDPRGTQHDESFMSVYKKYGIGITNDPLYLGKGEKLTTPHYATICRQCGSVTFYQGKPRTTKKCPNDGMRMRLFDVYTHKILNKNWRGIHARGNKITKKEKEILFKK